MNFSNSVSLVIPMLSTANYAIDIHNPEGAGTRWHEFRSGEWYEIPYRCLIPKGMKNLLVAGIAASMAKDAGCNMRDINVKNSGKNCVQKDLLYSIIYKLTEKEEKL